MHDKARGPSLATEIKRAAARPDYHDYFNQIVRFTAALLYSIAYIPYYKHIYRCIFPYPAQPIHFVSMGLLCLNVMLLHISRQHQG